MADDLQRYLDLAEKAMGGAVSGGASHAEAAAGRSRGIGVDVENSSVRSAAAGYGESLSVRAFVRGATACATVEGLEGADPTAVGAECARMAAAATPDPDFVDLPYPDPADEVPGLYDEAVDRFDVGEAVRVAVAGIEEAQAVRKDVTIQGEVGFSVDAGALANSNGIRLTRRSTSIHLGFFAIVREDEQVGSYHDFDVGRNLADVELSGLGRRVTEKAVGFLGARKIETGRRDLVLGPLAAYAFLQSILAPANAESIQRGRSFLINRLGQRIASPVLTVIDDPLVPRGIRSAAHDGEGTRRRRRTIIDRGTLASHLHNSYTAHKAGCAPTGHGTGGGGIAPTNLQVELGDRTAEEIIAETTDGIYINPGSIAPDPTSGDISSSIDFGIRIEGGRLVHPVINCLVGGSAWEVLDHIDAVSSDFRAEPGNVMPTIRIRDVLVAGGEG